ncbi:ras GEF [Phellopilus nigrolimitatus]|nr:ras GEF [Phellopilus nigrolimitatus]
MNERPSPSPSGLSGNHRLPTIPSLPPIEIPRTNLHPPHNALGDSSSLRVPESDDNQALSGRRSEESFTTAYTSPLAVNSADSFTAEVLNATQSMHTPPSLRSIPKSLSVDSFVREQQQRRDSAGASPVETLRSAGPSKTHNRLSSVDPRMGRRLTEESPEKLLPVAPGLRTLAQRVKRRYSTAEDEPESSAYEDSEFEQGHSGGKVVGRAGEMRKRLATPKRSGSMPMSKMPPQLVIPTQPTRKVPGVSPAASLANINTAHNAPRAQVAPEKSPTLRTKASAPTPLDTTRGRSQSISTHSDDSTIKKAKPSSLLHIDTEISPINPPKDAILMTLAIIGSQGCGKSSFIRRAWKYSRLTDAERLVVPAKGSDGTRVIHYIIRRAYMQAHEGRDYFLTLIEIGTQDLEQADGGLCDVVWPSSLPKIDGVYVLYDASDRSSFRHVEDLIRGYYNFRLPYIVLACKSDLPHRIAPADAANVIYKYDGGIVEISNNDVGKEKAKRCVGVLMRGVRRRRYGEVEPHLNPCSPVLYNVPAPWEMTPSPLTADSTATSVSLNTPISSTNLAPNMQSTDLPRQSRPPHIQLPPPPYSLNPSGPPAATSLPMTPPPLPANAPPATSAHAGNSNLPRSPSAPTSPTRARSMSDIIAEHRESVQAAAKQPHDFDSEMTRSKSIVDLAKTSSKSAESFKSACASPTPIPEPVIPLRRDPRQQPPAPWSTVEELLEKLFFLAVSGDDPSFIAHFFLTYRRFTTPRRILLAMQKRMIQLNQPYADCQLSAFAQLRICNLLEQWVHDYPSDFAVPGTAGALNALIKQVLRQTHTLYYGSDFLPFVEMLPTLHDLDSAWAVKAETSIAESDESDSNYGGEIENTEVEVPPVSSQPRNSLDAMTGTSRPATRERKSSIPLSAKTFLQGSLPTSARAPGPPGSSSPARDSIVRLSRASNAFLHFDSEDIAKEITREELDLYMKIEPRDWLRHTLVSGKKDPNHDRIARFNSSYNELHAWAASMILCHDKAKPRARVVEKLADVAVKLRNMNNYSGLRAIITAITQATYPNDEVMEIFKTKTDLHKKYLSSDILMRTAGAHQSYRLALRNTKGPCIPCLEVHTSDLRRAHEGNPDHKADDPSQLHWAKFNMIGKFVGTTTQLQAQCRGQNGYNFSENPQIAQLFDVPVMDYDMQQERLGPPPEDEGDMYSTPMPPTLVFDSSGQSRDQGKLKRLFFWA